MTGEEASFKTCGGTVPRVILILIHLDPPDLSQEREMESQKARADPKKSLLHLLISLSNCELVCLLCC